MFSKYQGILESLQTQPIRRIEFPSTIRWPCNGNGAGPGHASNSANGNGAWVVVQNRKKSQTNKVGQDSNPANRAHEGKTTNNGRDTPITRSETAPDKANRVDNTNYQVGNNTGKCSSENRECFDSHPNFPAVLASESLPVKVVQEGDQAVGVERTQLVTQADFHALAQTDTHVEVVSNHAITDGFLSTGADIFVGENSKNSTPYNLIDSACVNLVSGVSSETMGNSRPACDNICEQVGLERIPDQNQATYAFVELAMDQIGVSNLSSTPIGVEHGKADQIDTQDDSVGDKSVAISVISVQENSHVESPVIIVLPGQCPLSVCSSDETISFVEHQPNLLIPSPLGPTSSSQPTSSLSQLFDRPNPNPALIQSKASEPTPSSCPLFLAQPNNPNSSCQLQCPSTFANSRPVTLPNLEVVEDHLVKEADKDGESSEEAELDFPPGFTPSHEDMITIRELIKDGVSMVLKEFQKNFVDSVDSAEDGEIMEFFKEQFKPPKPSKGNTNYLTFHDLRRSPRIRRTPAKFAESTSPSGLKKGFLK